MSNLPIDWLQAALLLWPGAHVSCGSTYESIERTDGEEIPSEAALREAWAAYVPPVRWTAAQLLGRFFDAEADAIDTANTPLTRRLMRTLQTNTDGVASNSPTLAYLLGKLVETGLLTQIRAAEILNPEWKP